MPASTWGRLMPPNIWLTKFQVHNKIRFVLGKASIHVCQGKFPANVFFYVAGKQNALF